MLKVISNTWYAEHVKPPMVDFEKTILPNHSGFAKTLARKSNLFKNFLFFRASLKFDRVLISIAHPGVYYFILFEWLLSRRRSRLLVLEFIRAIPYSKTMRILYPLWSRMFLKPALSKTLCKAQVLTTYELSSYSEQFGIKREKLFYIPWPLHFGIQRKAEALQTVASNPLLKENIPYVMVSGLNNVDWQTVITAAENGGWTLLAVCSQKHRAMIEQLAAGNPRIIILNDISQYEHAQYVKKATVFVISLLEYYVSVGQIRFMNSIENEVPVVVSDVVGLRDYAVDGVNALIVPPNNANALQQAVDNLLKDESLRQSLVNSAKAYMKERTFITYISQIEQLVYQ